MPELNKPATMQPYTTTSAATGPAEPGGVIHTLPYAVVGEVLCYANLPQSLLLP